MNLARRSGVPCASRSVAIPIGTHFLGAVCQEKGLNYRSLDCRHAFCGPCIAGWFASRHSNTCPECRAACVGYPQRDFALRDVIQMVYSGLGRGAPTYENFDSSIFIRIYAMIEQCRALGLSNAQMEAFWAPMLAEIQRIRGVVISSGVDGAGSSVNNAINVDNAGSSVNNAIDVDNMPGNDPDNAIDVDVDMGGDGGGSDWELGSGVDSGESESETGDN